MLKKKTIYQPLLSLNMKQYIWICARTFYTEIFKGDKTFHITIDIIKIFTHGKFNFPIRSFLTENMIDMININMLLQK